MLQKVINNYGNIDILANDFVEIKKELDLTSEEEVENVDIMIGNKIDFILH